jgi:hypothetical protein
MWGGQLGTKSHFILTISIFMTKNKLPFEGNIQAQIACDIVSKTQHSICIYGAPNTGKSEWAKEMMSLLPYHISSSAPTKAAARNIHGVSIFSEFGLPIEPLYEDQIVKDPKLIRLSMDDMGHLFSMGKKRIMVIDNVNSVASYQLDAISAVLKRIFSNDEPFGGRQMIFLGDPLGPIPKRLKEEYQTEFVKRYKSGSLAFFESHAFKQLDPLIINFESANTKNDKEFAKLICNLREGNDLENTITKINSKSSI